MSFTEKLRWLEEADRLSRKFQTAREKLKQPTAPSQ